MVDTLVLFFTRGVSLKTWLQRGMFDREKSLYEEHLRMGHVSNVLWMTYGADDADIARQLHAEGRLHHAIQVVGLPQWLEGKVGNLVHSLVMPMLFYRTLQKGSVFKTNQMDGAWTAVMANALFGRPLIVRTGFTLSLFEAHEQGERSFRCRLARALESFVYKHGDMAAVSSHAALAYVTKAYAPRSVRLLPNYVDTNLFYPGKVQRTPNRLTFVGRLHAQKNLAALIPVLREAGYGLDIYGEGPEGQSLREMAARCRANVTFHGSIANEKLPDVFRRAETFILPSLFEGMPKALLEAMACGCVCVGADVPGVNEVIRDNENGLLAQASTEMGFRAVLQRLRTAERQRLAEAGVSCIKAHYSLSAVAATEAAMLEELIVASA